MPAIDLPSTAAAAWALGTLVKGTLLLTAVALLAASLRRGSAALRHLIWSAGIVTVLALPVLSLAVPWRLAVIDVAAPPAGSTTVPRPAPALERATALEPPRVESPATAEGRSAEPAPPGVTAAPIRWPSRATILLALPAIWAAGALVLLARLALGAAVVTRIVRRATRLETPDWTRPLLEAADRLALRRLPRLVTSDRLPMPFACGIIQPTIVLPRSAAEWSDRRRRAVLCHELAHVRRLDLLLNALGQVACAVYWFHPLVWVAARRLRIESERACDDLVLGVGTRASEYADHLLHIVSGGTRARTPAVALPMAQRHEFEGRMLAILEREARRHPPSRLLASVLAALSLALVLPLAALGIAQSPPGEAGAPPDQPTTRAEEVPDSTANARRAASVSAGTTTVAEARTGDESAIDSGKYAPNHRAGDRDVAAAGAIQAADTGRARVVAALARALDDPIASVREDAAYALGQLEAAGAVAPLSARLLKEPSPDVREMVVWALAQIEDRRATEPLAATALQDSSEAVRAMAAWALGQLEDPASVTPLAALLRDPSPEVRGRAAWALGTIGAHPAPTTLIAAVRDSTADVRLRAAWALGQIGDSTATPVLAAALRDDRTEVRRAVLWALGRLTGATAQNALLQALQDPDPEIRAQAARALGGSGGDPWPWPWPMPIVR